jgi:hypothetical protein
LGKTFGLIGMGLGFCHLLGSFLLRHPGWRIQDEASKQEETA